MKKVNIAPDFYLQCNCFLHVQKGAHAMGMEILGIAMYTDKKGNSGLSIPVLKHLINPNGSRQQGMIPLNYCPFCGKQIVVTLPGGGTDGKNP